MAKSKTKTQTTEAYSKKNNHRPNPAKDNPSKLQPTDEANTDIIELDDTDGLIKLLIDNLKDIYWAENHLVKSLPKMAKATSLPTLREAILNHLEQTKTHVERLEKAFELLNKPPQARKCDAMEGLTKEGEAAVENTDTNTPARNLGIIMSAQKVEHYEMAAYMGLIKLSSHLGYSQIAELLEETLNEEEDSDVQLSNIAKDEIVGEVEDENENN